MQSVDEFKPSTTEPVFGSGLISQTKTQQQANNNIDENEKVIPPAEPVVNGQNDTTVNKVTLNENVTNGKTESVSESNGTGDSSVVHVNGENEKPPVETVPEINNDIKPVEVEPIAEPQPVLPTPVATVSEGSLSAPTTTVDTAPPVETTTNDNVPEVPATTESETPEPKSKSPRGKAKPPVVTTTPTRQSSRGRKTASSSSVNVEENPTNEDTSATTTINQTEPSTRTKRQAATVAKDAIAASTQENSALDDANDQEGILSDADVPEVNTKKVSPAKKRGASTSAASAAKKAKGKTSITLTDDVDSGAATSESETIQSPPKKARTSATKTTPEPSGEYVRKLRPRK